MTFDTPIDKKIINDFGFGELIKKAKQARMSNTKEQLTDLNDLRNTLLDELYPRDMRDISKQKRKLQELRNARKRS